MSEFLVLFRKCIWSNVRRVAKVTYDECRAEGMGLQVSIQDAASAEADYISVMADVMYDEGLTRSVLEEV